MASFHLPVRPNLGQLRKQAKELLRDARSARPWAIELFREHHPESGRWADPRLADAQLVLARSYGVVSWPRLKQACTLIDAIWRDDVPGVESLISESPHLLHEDARGTPGNWGPPMSYAANLGRDRIITRLHELGARDLQHAFDRACLQGRTDTARNLYALGARPAPGAVMGPAETLSGDGMEFLLDLGAQIADERGDPLAPVALVLETYCRNPAGKHKCLELLATHGPKLPDTPPMAVHRGRIDLLERHLRRDASILSRTYEHEAIYPPGLGCHADPTLPSTARRSPAEHCCTCVSTTMSTSSPNGCWPVAPIRTAGRRSTRLVSGDTRPSSGVWSRSRIGSASARTTRWRGYFSTPAPTQTPGHRFVRLSASYLTSQCTRIAT